MEKLICLSAALLLTDIWVGAAHAEDLAKASQNPIGNIISLPLEVWHYDGMPAGTEANMFVAKPVYPLTVGSTNIINRLIIPYIDLDGPDAGADFGKVEIPRGSSVDRNGWGNYQYQAFFTPANPGKVILGVGPVLEFPTHTDGLGSDKWSAGIGAVALTMPGNWVVGGLLQNIWSYAGPDRARSVKKNDFPVLHQLQLRSGVVPHLDADYHCQLGGGQRQPLDDSSWWWIRTPGKNRPAAGRLQIAGLQQCGKYRQRPRLERHAGGEILVPQMSAI